MERELFGSCSTLKPPGYGSPGGDADTLFEDILNSPVRQPDFDQDIPASQPRTPVLARAVTPSASREHDFSHIQTTLEVTDSPPKEEQTVPTTKEQQTVPTTKEQQTVPTTKEQQTVEKVPKE